MKHKNRRNLLKRNGYRKGIQITFVLVIALLLLMTGCGGKKEKEGETQNTENPISESRNKSPTDESDLNGNEDSEFDFSQVFDNIEINGTKVSMPFTLNDLGEGYEFKYTVDYGDGTFGSSLYYNGNDMGGAYVIAEDAEDVGNDSPIYRLELYNHTYQNIKINGISFDSSAEEIEKAFENLPFRYDKNGEQVGYVIRNSDNVFRMLMLDGKLETITIIKGDELNK